EEELGGEQDRLDEERERHPCPVVLRPLVIGAEIACHLLGGERAAEPLATEVRDEGADTLAIVEPRRQAREERPGGRHRLGGERHSDKQALLHETVRSILKCVARSFPPYPGTNKFSALTLLRAQQLVLRRKYAKLIVNYDVPSSCLKQFLIMLWNAV